MTADWRENFLRVLRAVCRKKFNLSGEDDYGLQTKIAKALNINPNLVSGWFKKSFPNPENLIQIYNVFGISPNELLGIGSAAKSEEATGELKSSPSSIDLTRLIGAAEAGVETEDFVSFPIQTLNSNAQSSGRLPGRIIIHKRVFGRRKSLAAVQINEEKEIKIAIIGK